MDLSQTIVLYQPLLHKVAFKLLKCKADAEDIVQETFLKWLHIDQNSIENTKAYLITAVTNNCLNHLNALKRKKEEYWDHIQLSDWVKRFKEADFSEFDLELELNQAFKYLNTKLEPLERAVYLLKEVFDVDYAALQQIFDKKSDHIRQLFSRAKKKLNKTSIEARSSISNSKVDLLESFKNACQVGPALSFVDDLKLDIQLALKS